MQSVPAPTADFFYRATPQGRARAMAEREGSWSPYLNDLLNMCGRGAWERELRQFMPPASLRTSLERLLALGLIECADPRSQLLAA
ncbi:MAG: hypothetical protein ACXWJM_07395 [Ramlibacter sp.]